MARCIASRKFRQCRPISSWLAVARPVICTHRTPHIWTSPFSHFSDKLFLFRIPAFPYALKSPILVPAVPSKLVSLSGLDRLFLMPTGMFVFSLYHKRFYPFAVYFATSDKPFLLSAVFVFRNRCQPLYVNRIMRKRFILAITIGKLLEKINCGCSLMKQHWPM